MNDIERYKFYADETIKILDWFAENMPNQYHGYFGDTHESLTTSEMVIKTIQNLQARIKELEEAR